MDSLINLANIYPPADGYYVCGVISEKDGQFYATASVRDRDEIFSHPLPCPDSWLHTTRDEAMKSLDGIRDFVRRIGFGFEIDG